MDSPTHIELGHKLHVAQLAIQADHWSISCKSNLSDRGEVLNYPPKVG